MAAAPLDAEGAEVAANFARFAAALDDTLKVVSKPKEWKADEQTAAHWARWSFQIKNYFALLHVQMLEWLTIVEATNSEDERDILRMTPYEKMYSRVIYSILVQVLPPPRTLCYLGAAATEIHEWFPSVETLERRV